MPGTGMVAKWESLHAWGIEQPVLQRFTEILRVLLSAGFFGPGMVKLLGFHFVPPGMPGPAGALFDALYAAGPYWNFIGGSQVAAAVLLMVPPLAPIGAIFMFVVLLNIVVITTSLQFGGTMYLTALMLLGCIYLLLWDYPRWKLLLPGVTEALRPPAYHIPTLERMGYLACALSGWMVFSVFRGFIPESIAIGLLVAGPIVFVVGAVSIAVAWIQTWQQLRRDRRALSVETLHRQDLPPSAAG